MILAAAALAAGAAAGPPSPAPRGAPQSLVLVTLDTTRADHLGCYGAAAASTPILDALARSGARFALALSPSPLTAPAHASIMTGRVPRRHGLRDNAGFVLPRDVPTLASVLRGAGYETAAFVSSYVLDRATGIDRGFRTYDDTVRVGDLRAFNREERAASQTVDRALARLPALTQPYFLWIHFYDPHRPYVPPEPYASRFSGRPYDGEIAFMDAQLGRLLDAIRRRGDSCLVVAAGDHGESLGEHGEDGHGVFLYQATQRVPLIVAGRGIAPGRVVADAVGLVDLVPTILDLLGRPVPDGLDGRSLAATLRGEAAPARRAYEMETFYPAFAFGWAPLRALVDGSWKYVLAPRPELYELPTDPREMRDLARVPARVARAEDLRARVVALAGDDAPVPRSDPDLDARRDRLASLGYVGASTSPGPGPAVDPKDGIAWLPDLEGARREIQSGKPQAAVAPLERLLARNPDNVQALLTLAAAREAAGDPAAAAAAARRAIALAPASALAHLRLAGALSGESATRPAAKAESQAEFERALAMAPRYAPAVLGYAGALAGWGRLEDARRVLEQGRSAGVEDPEIESEVGAIEAARGNRVAARSAFERALVLNPREAGALERLGRLDYEAGNFTAAERWYALALEAAPTAALAKTLGAIRMEKLSDPAGAAAAFRRALELAPNDPDAEDLRRLIRDGGR